MRWLLLLPDAVDEIGGCSSSLTRCSSCLTRWTKSVDFFSIVKCELRSLIWRCEMKTRVVCRKIYDYIRYDLKEIAFPSSLPRTRVLKRAARLYAASWLREKPNSEKKPAKGKEPSTLDDLVESDGYTEANANITGRMQGRGLSRLGLTSNKLGSVGPIFG
ncbi:hypothetical protein Ahy_A05g023166 isoform D [Arachis hypogaea]|uniref:Uncharacterized protein n=1 Tax=Arachis hypogaea TaxID=3818 RepID=A0A445D2J4_ARAHY|nr:hypothetical protein Ahy_A05g023166 isoform D [Arachis hypogaea]